MKRDLAEQARVLQRIVDHEFPRILFESYSYNVGGFEDVETPLWSRDEAHHLELLILEGFLGSEKITDAPWLGAGRSDSYAETYVFLTPLGYDWIENRGLAKRFLRNVSMNIPTVITSVVVALLSAGLLKLSGLTK